MIQVKKLAELPGHQNPIYTVENASNSDVFFTAGNDKGVVQWNITTKSFEKVLLPVASSVYALHIYQDLLAIGERSGQVSIYDFSEQKVIHTLRRHQLPIFDIRSFPSKEELLVASEDGTVSVWSTVDFNLIYQLPVSAETVRVIAVSPDATLVALGCKDNMIRIYNLEDYSLIAELNSHTLPVTALQFSPDGTALLSGGRDAALKIWNTKDFSLQQSITAHMFTVYDIKFHPSQPFFATASRDKSIKIWGAEDFKLYKIINRERGYESHTLSINKIAWDPKSENLISVGDDKLAIIWEILFDD